MIIEVHIDELVLVGVSPGDRETVATRLATTVAQAFDRDGVPPGLARSGTIDRLTAGPVTLPPDAAALGTAVGVAVAGRLARR